MNDRIQALRKQAGGHYNSGNQHTWPEYTIDDPEKFAELIVKECADIADKAEPYKASDLIKEHFGVEEQVNDSKELHTCPYREEIHNDYESLCDCDEEQQRQCAMDI